jgi:hypothetical protein
MSEKKSVVSGHLGASHRTGRRPAARHGLRRQRGGATDAVSATHIDVEFDQKGVVEMRIYGLQIKQDGSLSERELDHRWRR